MGIHSCNRVTKKLPFSQPLIKVAIDFSSSWQEGDWFWGDEGGEVAAETQSFASFMAPAIAKWYKDSIFTDVAFALLPVLCYSSLPFVKNFTFKEIKKATKGFSIILRSNSHGTIYKARFPDGLTGAVKRVRCLQLEKDVHYKNLELLGRLHHRHLVGLKGFSEGKDRFLIFDYMHNGSLKDCLHDPLRTPLNWRTRIHIAIDVAAALDYLLYFCEPPVHNITINSSNILLDKNFVAKLSDAAFADENLNHPDESNAYSPSEDNTHQQNRDLIFQFGVLLLELVTGQSLTEEAEIIQCVQESGVAYLMHNMVDADLEDNYDLSELKSLLAVARLCISARRDTLISIPQILRYLQGKIESSTL